MGLRRTVHRTAAEVIRERRERQKELMKTGCAMITADAKLLAPVDTTELKRRIDDDVRQEGNKTIGTVFSPVDYAYWAEQKQPHLEPAVDQNLQAVKNLFRGL
ncbi:HK97 gp10 family phage protein [Bacillus spongiae]|uniref:HK97 gp10 family phage protein n=1 Tax=Bacillus spongiae TaxID=2683610 RepID=A0ABU8HJ76_9BACI